MGIQVGLQWAYILDNQVLFGIKGYHRKVVLDTGKDGRESAIYCREKWFYLQKKSSRDGRI